MDAKPTEPLAKKDVVTDLRAALEARRELGGDLEEHVLEAFLARVQDRIDAQVREQLAQSGSRPAAKKRGRRIEGWVIPASLGLAIPLVAIAGGIGGAVGILAVMIAVVVLVGLYFEYGHR
jgi:hypothetical protein